MKAYLLITGTLFGMLGGVHLARTIAEWRRLAADPGFIVEGPVIGLVAASLCIWSMFLLRAHRPARSADPPAA